jgi:transcriptional regulator with XRE-family HTH domain
MSKKQNPCCRCHGSGDEPDNGFIGRQLRANREHEGISLRAMALKLGVSSSFLSQLERGDRTWKPELVLKCLKILKR